MTSANLFAKFKPNHKPYTNPLKQINTQLRWLEMVKTVDLKEATNNLQKLLEEITEEDNQYIIKSNGQNIAVLLSYNDYQDFTAYQKRKERSKKRFFEIVDQIRERNKDVPYEQIEKDVAQAVAEVKQMELEKLQNQ